MANLNLNEVTICGHITKDPELKATASGMMVTTFTVAVNENEETEFFNVKAWRERAQFITKYFRGGSSIYVKGKLKNRSWTDEEGRRKYATEILALDIKFVDSKREKSAPVPSAASVPGTEEKKEVSPMQNSFVEIEDPDLPF